MPHLLYPAEYGFNTTTGKNPAFYGSIFIHELLTMLIWHL